MLSPYRNNPLSFRPFKTKDTLNLESFLLPQSDGSHILILCKAKVRLEVRLSQVHTVSPSSTVKLYLRTVRLVQGFIQEQIVTVVALEKNAFSRSLSLWKHPSVCLKKAWLWFSGSVWICRFLGIVILQQTCPQQLTGCND